jgi:hypothetical protein
MRRMILAPAALLLCMLLLAAPVRAQDDDDEGHPVIVWVGTVATNLFYMPVKTVHAGLGGLVGGMAWLVTGLNPEVSQAVFDHTILTSWYVTPKMLEGRQDLNFFGGADD